MYKNPKTELGDNTMNTIQKNKAAEIQINDLMVAHERKRRQETVAVLRDIAFVLKITERVKAAILEQPELAASVMA